jgi:hypothetical protein
MGTERNKYLIEHHPKRKQIEKALIKQELSLAEIGKKYGIHPSTLSRYRKNKLVAQMAGVTVNRAKRKTGARAGPAINVDRVQAKLEEDELLEGIDLLREVNGIIKRVRKLFDACDAYLTDPADPSRYTLAPRAEEILVQKVTYNDRGAPTYESMTLQEALYEANNGEYASPQSEILQPRNMANDPRTLVLSAAKGLQGQMKLLIDYAAELRAQGNSDITRHPEYHQLEQELMEAFSKYPELVEEIASVFRRRESA